MYVGQSSGKKDPHTGQVTAKKKTPDNAAPRGSTAMKGPRPPARFVVSTRYPDVDRRPHNSEAMANYAAVERLCSEEMIGRETGIRTAQRVRGLHGLDDASKT